MIASGEKKEEYREIKPYWFQRLYSKQAIQHFAECWDNYGGCMHDEWFNEFQSFDQVSANNGYAKDCPNVSWQHKGIRIGQGNPEWGAEPGKDYFILDIGNIIK